MGLLERANNIKQEDEHPLAPAGLRARAELLSREEQPAAARRPAATVATSSGSSSSAPASAAPAASGLLARARAFRELSSAAMGLRARAEMFRREGQEHSDAPSVPAQADQTSTTTTSPAPDASDMTAAPVQAPADTSPPRGLLARAMEIRDHVPPPISEEEQESLKAEVGTGLLARAEALRNAPDEPEPSAEDDGSRDEPGDLVLDEFQDDAVASDIAPAATSTGTSKETTASEPPATETSGEADAANQTVPPSPKPPPRSGSDAAPSAGAASPIHLVAQEGREVRAEPPLEPDPENEVDIDETLEQDGGPPTADELELGLLTDSLPEPEEDDLALLEEDYTIGEGDDELPDAVKEVMNGRAADVQEKSDDDLHYEGNSDPNDDPALDGVREETEAPETTEPEDDSGFAGWERKAEREAERRALSGAPQEEPVKEEVHLFSDDDMTTRPVETHIAGQKKIDNYLSLFDISKEISNIDDSEALWDAVLYAVMGQLGAESICIFSSANKQRNGSIFYPTAHSGFDIPLSGWVLKPGDHIYEVMKKERGVRYADEFLNSSQLSELERDMLQGAGANLVVPLKNMDRMFGIMLLGRQLSGDDYGIDDLEFLSLLGEVAAVGVDRVIARLEYEQDTEELRRQNAMHGRIFSVARNISGIKDIDELYDILTDHLTKDFGVESYSVVLLHPGKQEYRIFGGNQISPATIDKFKLDVSSELIGLISNLTRVYELPNFRSNPEITGIYTNDDLALMQHYWIVPLISLNWLVGFMTIHRTSVPWTEYQRELAVSAAEMMAPVFANAIILGERETIFRDPFSPLEGRLRLELKKAREFDAPVSMVEMRVKNLKRLIALNPQEHIAEFLADLGRSIAGFLFETDFLARISQGRFALILPGRTRKEAEVFTKKLKAEFKRKRLLPGSPLDIQYSYNIVVSPEDTDDPGRMLAMLD